MFEGISDLEVLSYVRDFSVCRCDFMSRLIAGEGGLKEQLFIKGFLSVAQLDCVRKHMASRKAMPLTENMITWLRKSAFNVGAFENGLDFELALFLVNDRYLAKRGK